MAFYRQPNWAKTLQKVEPFGAFTRLFVRCKYVTGRAGRPQKLQIWAITKRQANSPKTWNAVNKSNYQIYCLLPVSTEKGLNQRMSIGKKRCLKSKILVKPFGWSMFDLSICKGHQCWHWCIVWLWVFENAVWNNWVIYSEEGVGGRTVSSKEGCDPASAKIHKLIKYWSDILMD